MGIWTTVNIVGTCDRSEVSALRAAIDPGRNYENFHCLSCGGLAGLNNWASEIINAAGNLAERDYDAESVRETLEELAKKVPSLKVKVHVGRAGESLECVNTVTLDAGKAVMGPPEIQTLQEKSQEASRANFLWQMSGRRGPNPSY